MIDRVDRLCDDFWTDTELEGMAELVINPSRHDPTPKHLCWYHLLRHGEYTGKAMLLAVESIVDGQEAVNAALAEHELSCAIGEYGDESVLNGLRAEAAYLVLGRYEYIGKIKFSGANKVFTYENWMAKLV